MLRRRQLLPQQAVRIITESGAWRRARVAREYDRTAQFGIWVFLLFVMSLPFESVAYKSKGEGLASISSVVGYVLLAVALLRPHVFFRKPVTGVVCFVLWLFMSWGYCFAMQPDFLPKIFTVLYRRTQMVILLWMSASLLRDHALARRTLICLAAACCLLFVFVHTVGGGDPGNASLTDQRLVVFNEDPNFLACLLAIGVIAFIAQPILGMKRRILGYSAWLVGLISVASLVIQTASRSAILGLGVALPMLALQPGRPMARVGRLVMVVAACGAFVFVVTTLPVTKARFEAALQGKMGNREKFLPAAVAMFSQEPLLGWGIVDSQRELRRRESGRVSLAMRATHNIYLAPLLESGLLGGAPYLLGLGFAWVAAWRSRSGPRGIIPFIYIALLCGTGMGFNNDAGKGFWLCLGYIFASDPQGWLPKR